MELAPYLAGVLGAITLYVLFRKPMRFLVDKGWNTNLSAIVLMLLSFIIILVPVAGIIMMLGSKVDTAVEKSEKVVRILTSELSKLENRFDYDFTSGIDAEALTQVLSDNLQGFASGTFTMFITVAVMYFLLFYMLINRKSFRDALYEYIPIQNRNLKKIGKEIKEMVNSNALGIPLVALAQGVIALIGFFIFGVQNPIFWAVVVTIGSMIPFVGSMLGTIPVFILSYANGDGFQAWGILLYGILVVGSTDNIIRLYVLQKLDNVHPLVTLIGVIVGLPLFGFIGLIFGPLLVSLFLIIVRMYRQEYGKQQGPEEQHL
jgi:predicted PurR-regulated permease PerM